MVNRQSREKLSFLVDLHRSKTPLLKLPNKNMGTQSQFSENICSEDDLRSSIFGNICCKISCLPASPRIFEHTKNGIIAHF